MSRNKKGNTNPQRLKTLESKYNCGRYHDFTSAQKTPQLNDLIKRKLDMGSSKSRVPTLPSYPNKTRLQPIKQAKIKRIEQFERRLPAQQEKQCRLRTFLQSNDQLLEKWKEQENFEKEMFKKRLKLAALSSHKSLGKSHKKINQQLKHSLKNINHNSTKFPSPERFTTKHFNLRPLNKVNQRIENLQASAYKYYLQNLLTIMQQNRQSLLKSKKKLKKQIQKELKQEKEYIFSSKNRLVKQIQSELLKEQENDKLQKMERYRRELQAELEQQLSEQMKTNEQRRIPPISPQGNEDINPQKSSRASKRVLRRRSTTDLKNIDNSEEILADGINVKEQEKCIKIVDNYIIEEKAQKIKQS